jgi:hypothetical protein
MSDNMMMEDSIHSDRASSDTSAQILQGTFKHYFEMAMDHHTKAATTSNFLLIIVGVIISVASSDGGINGTIDIVSGLAVLIIGLFGMVWTRKQLERYTFWQYIAHQYQKDLAMIVPELKTEDVYLTGAEAAASKKYSSLAKIHERWLWASLHGIVAVIGLGLMLLAAWNI